MVLFDSVCVSVVPTNTPAGAALLKSKVDTPDTATKPAVGEITPVPPCDGLTAPVSELSATKLQPAVFAPVAVSTGPVVSGPGATVRPFIVDASTTFPAATVSVLFERVCGSVVPTTVPLGATFVVVTAEVPAPTRKLPDVSVEAPVPPFATASVPVRLVVAIVVLPDSLPCELTNTNLSSVGVLE
jgi:hypothetical protein